MVYLLAISVGSEPVDESPALGTFLDRLNTECNTLVSDFSTRFRNLAPPAQAPTFTAAVPTLFTAPDAHDFDSSYYLWTLLPIPSPTQLSALRQSQQIALSIGCNSVRFHRLPGFENDVLLPLWIISCWTRLHTLLAYAESWSQAKEWLQSPSQQSRFRALANQCLSRLAYLPLHAPIPSIPEFSTSHLSTFLNHSWLSDDHMNAASEFINSHTACAEGAQVLNTHFLASLALHRRRSPLWNPSRPRLVDLMVADGRLTNLYIPVHEESHWTLVQINVPARTYEYTNTMSLGNLHAPTSCVESLNWWLSSILPEPIVLTPVL